MSNSSRTITINSGHVADALDSQIVMLAKTIQVEHPDEGFDAALTTTREYLNKKVVELIHEDEKEHIYKIAADFKQRYKDNPNDEVAKSGYILCKYMGLYKYLAKD